VKKIMISLLLVFILLISCSCKGESAYEIAIRNGFSGSEVEWLESLKGKNGVDGKDGKDGVDGKDGKDGVDGKDGMNYNDIFVPGQIIVFELNDIIIPDDWSGSGSQRRIERYSPYKNINYKVTFTATTVYTNEEILLAASNGKRLSRYEYSYSLEITGSKENAGLLVPYTSLLKEPENYGFTVGYYDYYEEHDKYPVFDKNGNYTYEGQISFSLPLYVEDLVITGFSW